MKKLKAILSVVADVVILVKKVKEDGKLDMTDAVHVLPFVQKLPDHIKAFSELKEAFEEAKEIDVASGLDLIQFIDSEVKRVEKA